MKNRFLTAAVAVLSLLWAASCDQIQDVLDQVVQVSLTADSDSFDANAEATVKVALNIATNKDVKVLLGIDANNKDYVAAEALVFENSVVIPAGQQFVPVKVSVDLSKAQSGQDAVILIASADGAAVGKDSSVRIKVTQASYGGDNTNGDVRQRRDWIISYEGYLYDEEDEDYSEVVKVTGQGETPIYCAVLPGGTLESLDGDLSVLPALAEGWLQEDLEQYSSYGLTIEDFVVSEDPHFEYFYGFTAGVKEFFVFGMTGDGKATGDYAWYSFTVAEDHSGQESQDEYYDRIAINGTGDALFYFDIFDDEDLSADNLEESLLSLGESVQMYVAFYNAFGINVDVSYFLNDSEYNYSDYPALDEGTYTILIGGMTEEGNLTGEYNISSINIDGRELARLKAAARSHNSKIVKRVNGKRGDRKLHRRALSGTVAPRYSGTPQLQSDWTVQLDGAPYVYGSDYFVDIITNLPGIQYYYIEENTQEDLDYYYDGSVAGMMASFEESFKEELAGGEVMANLAYSASDPQPYIYVYNPGVETTLYVVELDENGNATGRYGASKVNMPEVSGSGTGDAEVVIEGPLVKMDAWQAEYLGRYKEEDSSLSSRKLKAAVR